MNYITRAFFSTEAEARERVDFPGSVRTARTRVRQAGLINSAAASKPFLTQEHKECRVGFALEFLNRDDDFWNKNVWLTYSLSIHFFRVRDWLGRPSDRSRMCTALPRLRVVAGSCLEVEAQF